MKEIVHKYKELSNKILSILKNKEINNDILDECFNEREKLINKLSEENKIEEFRKVYKKDLYSIDVEIKNLLQDNITEVKKEIVSYKKNKSGNFAYANMNKSNLNIFSKKV